jgi:hypothetical protein
MPFIIEDPQKFTRDAEEYVHTVILLAAPSQDEFETAALHVVGRLSAVLDAMFEGISAADAAQALGQPQQQFPALRD